MNLVRAEWERLRARRFVQLMLILLVLAFGVTAATTLANSHRPTATELASAQREAADARRGLELAYEQCVAREQGRLSNEELGLDPYYTQNCADIDPGRMERLPVAADFLRGVFTFAQAALPLLYFLIAFLVLFGFLVGASYIGADLNSGGVVNLLLWRPNRTTVLGTKLGTLLGVVGVVSLLASAAYLGTFWLIGQAAGQPGAVDGEFWRSLAAVWGRGMVLVLLASALGFAAAALGRHTAAALGVIAAYAVVWELGARLVMLILDVPRHERFLLSSYLFAWLSGRMTNWDENACRGVGFGTTCDGSWYITQGPALVVLLGLTGAAVGAAFVVFRRRDLI
ncbi:ABC transporter permease subunit [Micromonospora endolithica]|uniref:ABC transporter permease n=1 Tax=Micromonospora endolithica TaxID=230091 RepID=A0A3A9ZMA4_9ACTN|nr:ABC transporter permease subunit [Micromonospora endolithica]RKN49452.1 ABC transporter permease [Micromonospora endolithica]TWJ23653.1 ABC-type transport system involved in multi-copper enzyme maturation permease subunit [Micromonospora endolithica]